MEKKYVSWLGWFDEVVPPAGVEWLPSESLQSDLVGLFGESRISACGKFIELCVLGGEPDLCELVICNCENGLPKGWIHMPTVHN